jgi:hypothetical protein
MTSVEWLIDELKDNGIDYLDLAYEIIEKALELEKQQIENAWKSGDTNGRIGILKTKEQYYNETYKIK